MRIITKAQEEKEEEERRKIVEKKLRFLGYRVAELMASRYEKDIEAPIPDLGVEIRRMAEDIAWADNVID